MARLTLLILLTIAVPQPADAGPLSRWDAHIGEAARRFSVPAEWIRKVIAAESAGRTHRAGRPLRSRAGAMGLMQLMPATWAEMRLLHGLGSDPDDPRDNILAGTAYLRAMHDRFGYPGLFAAYNGGPGRYREHLRGGSRLPAETRLYVARLTRETAAENTVPGEYRAGASRHLFAVGTAERGIRGAEGQGLFVELRAPSSERRAGSE